MTELLEFFVRSLVEDPSAVVVGSSKRKATSSTRSASPRTTSAG